MGYHLSHPGRLLLGLFNQYISMHTYQQDLGQEHRWCLHQPGTISHEGKSPAYEIEIG
jgi:hypothetical protein